MYRRFLILLIMSIVVVSGCGSAKYLTYENTEAGFKIDYPENWTKEEGDGVFVSFFSPYVAPRKIYPDSVNVGSEKTSKTLDEVVKEFSENYKKELHDWTFKEIKERTINSLPAKEVIYTSDSVNGRYLGEVYLVVNGVMYRITYDHMTKGAEKDFEKMIQSFVILK